MTYTIVCFGDSNTYGSPPSGGERYARDVRWPGVMRAALGAGYEVIEEGLGGRTTVFDSPLAPYRNGRHYLTPCLLSHAPLDLVIIMLGTNDLNVRHHLSASEIASGAGVLVDIARQTLSGPGGAPPAVLLVSPVPVGPTNEVGEAWGFDDAAERAQQMAPMYRVIAEGKGAAFFEAGSVASASPDEGIHLEPEAHASLGAALAGEVRVLLA